jgi:hypothetical protein
MSVNTGKCIQDMEEVYDVEIDDVQLCITELLRSITCIDISLNELIN